MWATAVTVALLAKPSSWADAEVDDDDDGDKGVSQRLRSFGQTRSKNLRSE